jgi:hypothetical protein
MGNEVRFMMDNSRSDSKELIIDFMLSWTFRMSTVNDDGHQNVVKDYCIKILSKMMFDDTNRIIEHYKGIKSVKTWKQWQRIDLLAEVELIDFDDTVSKHVLVIENKGYSKLHGDQLNRYKEIVRKEYLGTEFEKNIHYVYFSINERHKITEDILICNEAGFVPYAMDDVQSSIWPTMESLKKTGHELFDEFWICQWG